MRAVYVSILILILMILVVYTHAFHFVAVVIPAGNTVYTEAVRFSHLFDFRARSSSKSALVWMS